MSDPKNKLDSGEKDNLSRESVLAVTSVLKVGNIQQGGGGACL